MTQLGRYEILQQLATGGVADVLLARASGLEGFSRHVVIKMIRPDLSADNRFAKAFLDEARIAASLHHQNIVQVYDIDEQAGAYFFTMEYVHGEDLRKILLKIRETNSMLPIDMAVAIATGAAAGLHHAHEQLGPDRKPLGLVHRDVSPGNILIGYDGSVKLVDFGLAKAALRSAQTRTGSLRGKAPYMSPELCCGKPIDRRSDTFALGIVLYELVTARRLFKSGNDFLTMAAIVEGSVEPPSVHRPDLPKRLDEIIMRALAKSPESRYQTADDLRGALESFSIDAELRTSGKAVADFMKKVFGERAEPWHEVAPPALDGNVDFDERAGLVSAPTENSSLVAKLSSGVTSPIALAQNLAQAKPDPGFEDDEEPTRHDSSLEGKFEPGADAPTAPRVGSRLAHARAATGGDGPTRIDLPPDDEAPTVVPGLPPRLPPAAADEDPPTLRGQIAAVRDLVPQPSFRERAHAPVADAAREDDELITQRQKIVPPQARLVTNSDVYDTTTVTPPLFPVQHPTHETRISTEPPLPRVPVGPPRSSRRWIVIGAAVAGSIIAIAVAIRSCRSNETPAAVPPDSAGSAAAAPAAGSAAPVAPEEGSATSPATRHPHKHVFEKPHRPAGSGAP